MTRPQVSKPKLDDRQATKCAILLLLDFEKTEDGFLDQKYNKPIGLSLPNENNQFRYPEPDCLNIQNGLKFVLKSDLGRNLLHSTVLIGTYTRTEEGPKC